MSGWFSQLIALGTRWDKSVRTQSGPSPRLIHGLLRFHNCKFTLSMNIRLGEIWIPCCGLKSASTHSQLCFTLVYASTVLLLLQTNMSLIVLTNLESSPCLPRRQPTGLRQGVPLLFACRRLTVRHHRSACKLRRPESGLPRIESCCGKGSPLPDHDIVFAAYPAHVGRLTASIKSLPNLGFVRTLTTRDVDLDSFNAMDLIPKLGGYCPTRFDYHRPELLYPTRTGSQLLQLEHIWAHRGRYRL